MNIVFITHPDFMRSQSMPRFASFLVSGMRLRGHTAVLWNPKAVFNRMPVPEVLKKWFGYIDQYLLFPISIRRKIAACPPDTLFVFTDNALGPWVPLVAHRRHVIHCHDFLALRSALGQIPQNKTGLTGRIYQKYIRRGFRRGRNFISVSRKTQQELHQFLVKIPERSEVVYNGLNRNFHHVDQAQARKYLSDRFDLKLMEGFILHIGGNEWYKNRPGLLMIYESWRQTTGKVFPLICIGTSPSADLKIQKASSAYSQDIHFIAGVNDADVEMAYAGASVLLFPSLAEGFGWPIAEAMACGCPVITTDEAPMIEVGGDAALYIGSMPDSEIEQSRWAVDCAGVLEELLNMSASQRGERLEMGFRNVLRFNPEAALDRIEEFYRSVLQSN